MGYLFGKCFQEESIVDITSDDDHQFDVIEDFSDDVLSLCRGRSQINDISLNDFSLKNILIERLEEDIVVRSLKCSYVFKKSPSEKCQTCCEFCQKLIIGELEVSKIVKTEFEDSSENNVSFQRTENSKDDENSSGSFEQAESNKASKLLNKLKSLNLPVTVSLSDKPPSKLKVLNKTEKPLNEDAPLRTESCDRTAKQKLVSKVKKSSDALSMSAVSIEKKKKKKSAIEITGKTVTNRCSWCGSIFHRLYSFMDHLKVNLWLLCRRKLNNYKTFKYLSSLKCCTFFCEAIKLLKQFCLRY